MIGSDAPRDQGADGDRRYGQRVPATGTVVVDFADLRVAGPARNASASGVYFVAEADVHVEVLIDGRARRAQLVRLEALGSGRTGVAVRFLDDD